MFSKQKAKEILDPKQLTAQQRELLRVAALKRVDEISNEIKNLSNDPYGVKLLAFTKETTQQMDIATQMACLNSKAAEAARLKSVKEVLANSAATPELYELYTKDPSFAGDLKAAGFSSSASAQPKR